MPGYLNDTDGEREDDLMGEDTGDRNPLGETPIRFTVSCAGFSQTYESADYAAHLWDVWFVTGYLAAKGYAPHEIEVTVHSPERKVVRMDESWREKLAKSQHSDKADRIL